MKNPDQIVLGSGTADCKELFFVMQVEDVGKLTDICQILFGKRNCFYGDGLSGLDHFFQFLFGAGSNHMSEVHDSNLCTDLLDFLHIMRGIDDSGALGI